MDPERMKAAGKAKTPPAEVAPAPSPTPAPAARPEPVSEPQISAPAPTVQAAPISGDLDPVTEAVLAEIPDRPTKAAPKVAAELEQEQPAPAERPALKGRVLALGGAVLLGVVALAVGGARARSQGSVPAPTPSPTSAPAAPAAPVPRAQGLVIGA